MDLYSSRALAQSRQHDLLREAANERLARLVGDDRLETAETGVPEAPRMTPSGIAKSLAAALRIVRRVELPDHQAGHARA